jgi:hypothetical protein
MPDPTPAQLVDAHAAARQRLTDEAAAFAAAQAAQFTSWYDSDAITEFAERVARRVQAAQRQTAGVTDSFLLRVLRLLLGRQVRSDGTVDVAGGLRVGVTPAGVYGRSADVYRFQRSLGKSDAEALRLAVERARVAAEMDVTLAFRAQVRSTLSAVAERQGLVPVPRTEPLVGVATGDVDAPETPPADAGPVLGYRRVIHPELSRGGSCGLCVAASTRTYGYADLLPIHARCACTVAVIVEDQDPGLELNQADYKLLYSDAGGTAGRLLKRGRYRVAENSELGTVLVRAGDSFRDAADVDADSGEQGAAA